MTRFDIVTGIAAPLMRNNIDTDAIIAARAMEGGARDFGAVVFTNWRFDLEWKERPEFVLNQPRYRGATFMVAGRNFGCGSSRESAVWALAQYGIRAVIAPSFGDIFHENALQNGLLPIPLEDEMVKHIAEAIERSNDASMTVDLVHSEIHVAGIPPVPFRIAPERRRALLEARGDFDLLVEQLPGIMEFEAKDRTARAWMELER